MISQQPPLTVLVLVELLIDDLLLLGFLQFCFLHPETGVTDIKPVEIKCL